MTCKILSNIPRCHAPASGDAIENARRLDDPLFTKALRRLLKPCGVNPVRYRPGELLMNIYAERFVKSIKQECVGRLIFVGEASLQKAINEYATHYNEERNHQGIDNNLINPRPDTVIPVGDPQAVENHAEIVRT